MIYIANRYLSFRALKPLLEVAAVQGIADFSYLAFWLVALDPHEHVHVAIKIRSFYEPCGSHYLCPNHGIAVVNLHQLGHHLQHLQYNEGSIGFQGFAPGFPLLYIYFYRVGAFQNQVRYVEMGFDPVTYEQLNSVRKLKQYEYDVVLGMSTEDFLDVMRSCIQAEVTKVSVTVTHEQVKFSADNLALVLPKGQSERGDGECIIGGVGEDDRVVLAISLRDIYRFLGGLPSLSGRVWLLHSNDAPLMLNVPIADSNCASIFIYVMPRCFLE